MMRVYFDNVAASGRVLEDLVPASEMEALREIERAHFAGQIKRVTSRESWREQERTKDPTKRAKLDAARTEVSVVASDHVVKGVGNISGLYGYGTTVVHPLVTDIIDDALFTDLRKIGLRDGDAKHFMYAFANMCDRFVTLDPDFLDRRTALETRCKTLRIVKPTELAAELRCVT